MGVIYFNNKSSLEYGIHVEHFPEYDIPEKDYEIVHVPGRNGDILIDKGSYQNTERRYTISAGSREDNVYIPLIKLIIDWLCSTSGYVKLSDSYEPEYYRLAMFNKQMTLENINNQATRGDIIFNCKPQRYLISGDVTTTFTSPGIIVNPTVFDSDPIIKVTGRGYATLGIGDYIQHLSMLTTSIGSSVGITRMKVNAEKFIEEIGQTTQTNFMFTCTGNSCATEIVSSAVSPITASVSNVSDFITAVGTNKLKKYTFVYHEAVLDEEETLIQDAYWTLDDVPIESISAYSVTITGTPIEGDTVIVRVKATWTLSGTVVDVADYGITFSGPPSVNDTMNVVIGTTITIDSQIMNCYSGSENKNQFVEFQNGFPKLVAGSNEISFDENITKVEVIPKWWTL